MRIETVSRDDRATASLDEDDADAASGDDESGPGPVYSPESPGADGSLSERDLAERSERDAASEAEQAADDVEAAEET